MRRRFLVVVMVGLGWSLLVLGCNPEDEPGGENPQDTQTVKTDATDGGDTADGGDPMDAEDGGDTDEADAEDGESGDADGMSGDADTADGSDADAGPTTCDYMEMSEGVCAMSTIADDGGGCQEPADYESDESSCDQKDNDCDGVTDEGCDCEFLGRADGICSSGSVSDRDGSCEPPADYESDESSCDDIDNDCDGVKDEGCRCLYQSKSDGVCANAQISADTGTCEEPSTFVAKETNKHCDGKDNDCDGEVDEECTCNPGATEQCYTGPSGTANVGICTQGSRTCNAQGSWDACMNETTPAGNESCDGKDNDCDGVTDEGCTCDYTMKTEGVCSDGLIGPKGNCKQPSTYQSDETKCDGKDNDCDGTVDENCPCAYDGQNSGVCGTAKIDPSSGMCAEPADYEQTESTCDSKDNDCDGDIDDADSDLTCSCNAGDTQMCYTGPSGTAGTGICKQGSQRCRMDGSWTMCAGQQKPKSEGGGNNCDGQDNDCDGVVDEGCTCNYDMKTEGVCVNQTRDSSGDCPVPNDFQSSEATCSDNLDNDCDGTIDCADSDCSGQSCGSGSGATCQNQGCVETSCTDGVDNDQDGRTDCLDSDCSVCGSGSTCGADGACEETNCENGTDDDGDGMPDCADPDCDNEQCGSTVLGATEYCCQGNNSCSTNCAP